MRVLRFLLRLFGWLLTPFVAWAASFLGAFAVALLASSSMSALKELYLAAAGGGLSAAVVLWFWLKLLRRSKRLQKTLQVTPEGAPVAVVEGEGGASTP